MRPEANTLDEFWHQFREHFRNRIIEVSLEDLMKGWMGRKKRTHFYRELVLPPMALALGLKSEAELLKIDFAMCEEVPESRPVPLVFIEYENNMSDAHNEVRKLCCVSAPLRVLITVGEWDDAPGVWPSGGKKKEMLTSWGRIIRGHAKVWPQPNILGVLVGEAANKDTRMRFYQYAFAPNGELLGSDGEVLLEIPITVPWPESRGEFQLTTFAGEGLQLGVDLDNSVSLLDRMEGIDGVD